MPSLAKLSLFAVLGIMRAYTIANRFAINPYNRIICLKSSVIVAGSFSMQSGVCLPFRC